MVAHRIDVYLYLGGESKEHQVFTLNPCKEAWTSLQKHSGRYPPVQSPTVTICGTKEEGNNVVGQAKGPGRQEASSIVRRESWDQIRSQRSG